MNFFTVPVSFIKSYINSGHTRSVNAKKNIIASFLIRGGSIAVSIILLPITLHYINPTEYGIWLTLSSIIGWFSFFDIGFGNGLRNKFTEAVAKNESEQARIYVSTTYAILAIIISAVLIIYFSVSSFLDWPKILNTSPDMMNELKILALIVFVFFCLQFVLQLITTILTADQQPAKASLLGFLGSLFSLLIVFILTKSTDGSLIYLGAALSATPVVVLALGSIIFFSGEYRKYAPSLKHVRFSFAKNLMALGLKFFIIQISFVVLFQTSNIIIAQLFGPIQVTSYNVAFKYFSIIPMGFSIILTPYWSAFTEAWIKKDLTWIRGTMKMLRLFWVMLSTLAIVMLVFSDFVFRLWVGEEVQILWSLSALMAINVIINAWNSIYSMFLNGVGIVKIQLYSGIIGMVLNIPMAILFGKSIGVAGVVLASAILAGLNMSWTTVQYNKIINDKAVGIWGK